MNKLGKNPTIFRKKHLNNVTKGEHLENTLVKERKEKRYRVGWGDLAEKIRILSCNVHKTFILNDRKKFLVQSL
jgi:hypothetical protein